MDIGFNHGAVDTNFPTFFNSFVFGKMDKTTVNGLPGLRGNLFDIFTKNRLFEAFIGNADKTKSSQTKLQCWMEKSGYGIL